ncbi:MAG: S1C family serine protease [Akkermansiaceae bacterium]|jgi:serine protease Do|nr:PDZ domain-containing protein [Luteolibacter sp.]
MKSQSHALTTSFIGVVSLFAANTLTAIEPAPDNAKPPAELEERIEKPNEAEVKMPFIGVVTAALPEMVADHLNLKAGTGVIVRTVSPESPAEKSGIKVNDVILNINETAVNDPDGFRAEIRSHKVGDKLKLKTIQKGKPKDLEVTLVERPANAFADVQDAEQLRDVIELNLGGLLGDALGGIQGQDGAEGLEIIPQQLELGDERLKMLRKQMRDAMEVVPKIQPEPGNIQLQQQSTIRMMDGEGSVEFKSVGKNSEVTVRDKANEIVWSGPWDTPQDKAAAPDDIRNRIERLNINNGGGGGLKFEFRK